MRHETLRVLRESSIVDRVEQVSFQGYGEAFRLEARAVLVNGWKLDVFLHRTGETDRYSFHLFDEDGIIIRWDNAPHHPEIGTHPHHKHVGEDVLPSDEVDVHAVLQEVEQRMDEADQDT